MTTHVLVTAYLRDRSLDLSAGKLRAIRAALADLVVTHGETDAARYSPNCLRRTRQQWIDRGISRNVVNEFQRHVIALFAWAVSHEVVPASVHQALTTVECTRHGARGVRDTARVDAAPQADVDRVLAVCPEHVALAIRLQCLTGARPGEILGLRVGDIDIGGAVWTAALKHHKTLHLGKCRILRFGPQAQRLLRARLLFPPETAVVMDGYRVGSYAKCIRETCVRLGITPWHPHQLRHLFATAAALEFPEDSVRAVLGHSAVAMTARYAHAESAKAELVTERIG